MIKFHLIFPIAFFKLATRTLEKIPWKLHDFFRYFFKQIFLGRNKIHFICKFKVNLFVVEFVNAFYISIKKEFKFQILNWKEIKIKGTLITEQTQNQRNIFNKSSLQPYIEFNKSIFCTTRDFIVAHYNLITRI